MPIDEIDSSPEYKSWCHVHLPLLLFSFPWGSTLCTTYQVNFRQKLIIYLFSLVILYGCLVVNRDIYDLINLQKLTSSTGPLCCKSISRPLISLYYLHLLHFGSTTIWLPRNGELRVTLECFFLILSFEILFWKSLCSITFICLSQVWQRFLASSLISGTIFRSGIVPCPKAITNNNAYFTQPHYIQVWMRITFFDSHRILTFFVLMSITSLGDFIIVWRMKHSLCLKCKISLYGKKSWNAMFDTCLNVYNLFGREECNKMDS